MVLLGILIGTGIYHWNQAAVPMPKPPAQQNVVIDHPEVEDIPLGNEVGNRCYGADLKVIVGTDAATINPVGLGKVTIINFWGTWCTGCIAELPYFDKIAKNYQDDVAVVAVHCLPDGNKPAREFADREYPGSPIVFAFDYGAALNDYYTLLGGRGAYPYTVIVDEKGVITHTFFDPLTYEKLEGAILPLLKD